MIAEKALKSKTSRVYTLLPELSTYPGVKAYVRKVKLATSKSKVELFQVTPLFYFRVLQKRVQHILSHHFPVRIINGISGKDSSKCSQGSTKNIP